MRRPVYVPEKIKKTVFTTVEALSGCCKPVYVQERPDNAFLTSEQVLLSTCMPVKCQRRTRKQFSPLWRVYEVGAILFMCGKDLITPV